MTQTNNLTFVTALFDLDRQSLKNGFGRSFDHYRECFSRMLQEVKYPMVIYTTADMNDFVWRYRSPENTRIINKTLDDLRTFPFYDQVQKIRKDEEWGKQSSWLEDSPQKNLELYSILTFFKFFFLNDCTHFNHFNSKYFVWLDSGISNSIGSPGYYFDENFETKITQDLKNNKLLYVAFPYDENSSEVHGFARHKINELCGTPSQHVCRGGLFAGSKDIINEMNDHYYGLLSHTLNSGYLGTEESIFTILSYQHKNKCNLKMIDDNGLIAKYLDELKTQPLELNKAEELALYFLVFNTPEQFKYTLNTWKTAYGKDFETAKKYAVDNSTDVNAIQEYHNIFQENNITIIHSGKNIGIQTGRRLVAEHFDKSDHDFYVFIEEDMGVYTPNKNELCKYGFQTYHPNLFDKSINIMKDETLDFLRLTFTEFYGACDVSWSYINYPQDKKDEYYPAKEGYLPSKEYSATTLNKPKVQYLGFYKGLPYAVGNFHYSNWPILFNKNGNKKIFLDTRWHFEYEAVHMSHAGMLWEQGKLKTATLLASPILHNRIYHYDGATRRENETYTN